MEILPITIVRAVPDDAAGMQDVFYYGWLATYPNEEFGITLDDIEDWYKDRLSEEVLKKRRSFIARPPAGCTILTAKIAEEIIGVCRVYNLAEHNQLQAIYVLPKYHDKGVGTRMWIASQKFLDSTKPTIVHVATYNSKAIAFYVRHGFIDTGRRMHDPKFIMKSSAIIPEMEMRREAGF